MKSKQFVILAVVAFIGGIVGGFVSDRLQSISPVFATGYKEPMKIRPDVIEANEFRVVDERGWPLARFYHHQNSKPAVASLEFYDGKPGGGNRLQLSMDKNSLTIIDEKGSVAWSAP